MDSVCTQTGSPEEVFVLWVVCVLHHVRKHVVKGGKDLEYGNYFILVTKHIKQTQNCVHNKANTKLCAQVDWHTSHHDMSKAMQ